MSQRTVGDRIRSTAEIQWARNRPLEARPPLPRVGDRVLFRTNDFFLDLHEAEVLAVDDQNPADPNLWVYARDGITVLRAPDPWPLVTLRVDTGRIHETREARLEGSAGWLWHDYRAWPRPFHAVEGDKI